MSGEKKKKKGKENQTSSKNEFLLRNFSTIDGEDIGQRQGIFLLGGELVTVASWAPWSGLTIPVDAGFENVGKCDLRGESRLLMVMIVFNPFSWVSLGTLRGGGLSIFRLFGDQEIDDKGKGLPAGLVLALHANVSGTNFESKELKDHRVTTDQWDGVQLWGEISSRR